MAALSYSFLSFFRESYINLCGSRIAKHSQITEAVAKTDEHMCCHATKESKKQTHMHKHMSSTHAHS